MDYAILIVLLLGVPCALLVLALVFAIQARKRSERALEMLRGLESRVRELEHGQAHVDAGARASHAAPGVRSEPAGRAAPVARPLDAAPPPLASPSEAEVHGEFAPHAPPTLHESAASRAPVASREPDARPEAVAPTQSIAPTEPAAPHEPARLRELAAQSASRDPFITSIPVQSADAAASPPLERSTPARAPREARSLEERVGSRIYVWIGAVALALAGVFLVKYSIDQDLLSPRVRVGLGVAFGCALIGAGETWRRNVLGQALSAAGIADLYACLLAAVHLYDMLGATGGFVLMIAITALAIVLSLRQGPAVALLGLAGGFVTPALLGGEAPRALPLFTWLLVLQGALLFTARKRDWPWLALLASAASFAWAALWLTGPARGEPGPWFAPYLLCSCALPLAITWTGAWASAASDVGTAASSSAASSSAGAAELTSSASSANSTSSTASRRAAGEARASAVALAWLPPLFVWPLLGWYMHAAHFGVLEWTYLCCACAGLLVVARLREERHALARIALLASFAAPYAASKESEVSFTQLAWVELALGALTASLSYACLWRSKRAGSWAALAAAALVLHTQLAWWLIGDSIALPLSWSTITGLDALALALAAWPLFARRATAERAAAESAAAVARARALDAPLGALAVGVSACVALALGFGLERRWIAASWALEIPVVLWVGARLRLRALVGVSLALLAAVAIALLREPVLHASDGDVLARAAWVAWGIGVPLGACITAAIQTARARHPIAAQIFACAALAFALALCALEVRNAFHPQLDLHRVSACEAGVAAASWIACALAALRVARRWPHASVRVAAVIAACGAACLQLVALVPESPLLAHDSVGTARIANALLGAYALPGLACAFAARELARARLRIAAGCATALALVCGFVLVTLEVRQGFRGEYLDLGTAAPAELYAYSAAWLVYGAALLVGGIATRSAWLRWASLAVLLAAIAKVFLYDMSELRDLWRVASFLGLGVCAIAVGWVYQRFVLPRARER